MEFIETELPGVVLIVPAVHGDERGYFMETWQARQFREAGIDAEFVQDNFSLSEKGTLRGLHYQIEQAQGKLVRVVSGEVFDVAVDLRKSSATFGQWVRPHSLRGEQAPGLDPTRFRAWFPGPE